MSTEQRNPDTYDLDRLQTPEIVMAINRADQAVALTVASAIDPIARAVDAIASRMSKGGRVFFVGSGTSGRLGVMEAAECPPTFGVPADLFQGIIAGGYEACRATAEGAEDDAGQAALDLAERGVGEKDVVVGVSASGRTPYTLAAVRHARALGALTVGIACSRKSELSRQVDLAIEVDTGPEVLAGSTRMKAGTAQKMILNMISTSVMARLGHVYSNLMVNVTPTSRKLLERAVQIIMQLTGASEAKARTTLEKAEDVKTAVVMLKLQCGVREAREKLRAARNLREVIG